MTNPSETVAYVALGSNLGDKSKMLASAIERLNAHDRIKVTAVSRDHVTAPAFFEDQPEFLNACAALQTTLAAAELLQVMLDIELELGRVRRFTNGPRTLDLDLLFYGDSVISEPGLEVPHPGIAERAFVLAPLVEVAPDYQHPVSKKTVSELWTALDARLVGS